LSEDGGWDDVGLDVGGEGGEPRGDCAGGEFGGDDGADGCLVCFGDGEETGGERGVEDEGD
jgi:hypothetical protein